MIQGSFIALKESIVTKLLVIVFSLYFMVTLSVTMIHLTAEFFKAKDDLVADLSIFHNTFAPGLGRILWDYDKAHMKSTLSGILSIPIIVGAKVINDQGELVSALGVILDEKGQQVHMDTQGNPISSSVDSRFLNLFWHQASIYVDGDKTKVGELTLYSSNSVVLNRVQYGFIFIIINSMIKTASLWIIFLWVGNRVLTRPLAILANATENITLDNLSQIRIDTKGRNELKVLEEGFNFMVRNLLEAKEKMQSYASELEMANLQMKHHLESFRRFVPHEFLTLLNKGSIADVKLGDCTALKMSILFSDIRRFTSISESISPEDNFRFLNSYLKRIGPIVREKGGFIDKYIGDAIMALFNHADDALNAAIAMQLRLKEYNEGRKNAGYLPIQIGIGINTGELMLGTIGEANRMEGTVISDSVNLASRMEGLTKLYGADLLISEHTYFELSNINNYDIRFIDRVVVKGKSEALTVYEVYNADAPDARRGKRASTKRFEQAWLLYHNQQYVNAMAEFKACLQLYPEDKAALIYLDRCKQYLKTGFVSPWSENMP